MKDLFGHVVPQQLELNFDSQEKEEGNKPRSVPKLFGAGILQLPKKKRNRDQLREAFAPLRTT